MSNLADSRKIIVFPKELHLRSTEEKWGVRKRTSARIRKKLLVLGTGRCGTMFTAHAMRVAGVKLLHEKVGEDGTVSHYFVTDSDWYPMAPWQKKEQKKHVGERRDDFVFNNIFHIVRNPLRVIPSMTKIFGSVTWCFYEENGLIPTGIKDPILRAMHLWLNHNTEAMKQATITFQVEKYEQVWPTLMKKLGMDVPYPKHLKPMNKTGGFKAYVPLTVDDMIQRDPKLAAEIVQLAGTFGYRNL